ncbi:MAG: MFS transporter [Myxococcota bacterium]|nr:MFS transporter [Myxococcota bacterium]
MSRGSAPELRGRALVVLAGLLVCQMGLASGYVFGVVMKNVVAEFEWSRAAFAAASAPLLLAMGLSAPLVGSLTERFGGRAVLSGAAVVLGLALVGFSQIQSLWQFYVASALLGIGMTGVGDVAVAAVAARWFRRQRGMALAIVYTGSNLGGIAVPIAVTGVAELASWRAAIGVLGVAMTVLILPAALLAVREPEGVADEYEPQPTPVAGGATADLELGEALRTRTFWVLAFVLFSFYFYYLGINQHLVPFLTDIGFSDARAAASLSGAVGLGVFAKLGMGVLADRIPKRRALRLNFALLAAASLGLLFVDRPGVLVAFLVAHGFATAAENVVLPLVVADCFGVRHLAKIYGALMVTLFPGGVLGPIFAGAVFDRLGDYRAAFALFAALNLLGLGALAWVRRETAEASWT